MPQSFLHTIAANPFWWMALRFLFGLYIGRVFKRRATLCQMLGANIALGADGGKNFHDNRTKLNKSIKVIRQSGIFTVSAAKFDFHFQQAAKQ